MSSLRGVYYTARHERQSCGPSSLFRGLSCTANHIIHPSLVRIFLPNPTRRDISLEHTAASSASESAASMSRQSRHKRRGKPFCATINHRLSSVIRISILASIIKITSRASCNLGMPSSPLVRAGLSRGRYRANIWNLTACGLQKYARETLKAWRSAMRSSMSVAQARASHGCSLLPTNDAGGLALSIRRQTSSILAVMQQLSTFWTEITTIGYF